jgi:ATP-dependent protease ClpP protease subunit
MSYTRFLIHQPSGSEVGVASDFVIQVRAIVKARERIARMSARETSKSLWKVLVEIERCRRLTTEKASDYKLVSRVIERITELLRSRSCAAPAGTPMSAFSEGRVRALSARSRPLGRQLE